MKQYLKLIRPYGMLFLGFTPVFCAIANGESNLFRLSILLLIGLLTHIFTFVQNDYYDIEIDRASKYVSDRPLVAGTISKSVALAIVIASFVIPIALATVFLYSIYSFVVLLFAYMCMTIYNRCSKTSAGMEYVLGLGVFSYGIFGALTVSKSVSILALLVSLAGFMQWLFSVGISANLKDVEYDSKLGIKTTPMVFGVKVANQKFLMPFSFKCYAVGVKLLHIIIISLPFFLGYTSIAIYNLPIPAVCFLVLAAILLFMTLQIISASPSDRDNMLRYEGVQEGLALLLVPIALMSNLVEKFSLLTTVLLIFLLIAWPLFWLRSLFGSKMIPLE